MSEKKSMQSKIEALAAKISGPLVAFSQWKPIQAVQQGLIMCMPVIIVGSVFLILYVLGSPSVGDSGTALLPFLSGLAGKFSVVNSLTLGFLGLYATVCIAMSYARLIGEDAPTAGLVGLVAFVLININGAASEEGFYNLGNFGAGGLFVGIITAILSVLIYHWFIEKNIVIRLPDSVPPNIGKAFSSLIPFAVIFTLCWLIRTVFEWDLVALLNGLLAPLFSAADNIGTYTLKEFLVNLLWSVGLHGDNMLAAPIFQPFELQWTAENAAALANGISAYDLPHIMTYSGVDRLTRWTATVWPLIFLMITSKLEYLRALGWACLPSALFTIVEPVIFGLPLALNPYLMIPYLVIAIVTALVSYGAFATGLIKRFFVTMPWATPPFILGPLGTGDWKTVILVIAVFLIGLLIYLPFWRMFEKAELAKQAENEQENEAAAAA